jgi:predicted Zn finger-like uncharacterized protein
MIVECPGCTTIFPVDPKKVPTHGVHARCTVCNEVFFVSPPEQEEPEEPEAVEVGAETSEAMAAVETSEIPGDAAAVEVEPAEPEAWEEVGFGEEEAEEAAPVEVAEAETWEAEEPVEAEPVEAEPAEPEAWEEAGFGEEEAEEPAYDEPAEPESWESSSSPYADTVETAPETGTPFQDEADIVDEMESAEDPFNVAAAELEDSDTSGEVPEEKTRAETAGAFTPTFGRRDPNEKAQRLARVLVSDIILYNPDRHQAATESGNLKEEFEEEIQKSWAEYVEQVGEDLATTTPYFTDALNDILAKGEEIF